MTQKYFDRLTDIVLSIRDQDKWGLTQQEYAEFEHEFFRDCEPKEPCEWCSGEQRLVCYKVISPTTRVLVSKTNYCPNCGRGL